MGGILLAELLVTELVVAELEEAGMDEREELARLLMDELEEERALDVAPTMP